jgi:hypothetical protein
MNDTRKNLDEAGFVSALGDITKKGIANARDRVLYGLGSHTARGRLDLNAATQHLYKDWKAYAGRHASAGDKSILQRPTLGQLLEFLKFQYGVEVTDDELQQISHDEVPDEETKPKSADDHAREALSKLKATSPAEYNALKAKFAKKNESVITEADITDMTFDPKVLFPKLANFLIQQGVITVARHGGKTAGSVATQQTGRMDARDVDHSPPTKRDAKADTGKEEKPAEEQPSQQDKETATSSAMTPDGHYIDANKFSDLLVKGGIRANQMDDLRDILNNSAPAVANRLRRNNDGAKALETLVGAALNSISNKNVDKKVPINVTASGNTVNLNIFKDELANAGISGRELNRLRDAYQDGNLRELIQNRDEIGKIALGVSKAIVSSIQGAKGAAKRGA